MIGASLTSVQSASAATAKALVAGRQTLVTRQRMGLDQGGVDARRIRPARSPARASRTSPTRESNRSRESVRQMRIMFIRPIRQRECRKASKAARSSRVMAATRSFAASASPPCQRIASRRLRARPSWRNSVWPLTVSVRPMPQSGGVRHSLPLASPFGPAVGEPFAHVVEQEVGVGPDELETTAPHRWSPAASRT